MNHHQNTWITFIWWHRSMKKKDNFVQFWIRIKLSHVAQRCTKPSWRAALSCQPDNILRPVLTTHFATRSLKNCHEKLVILRGSRVFTEMESQLQHIYYSRMRSKGSRFTLWAWGLRVCSLDVAFTSATVRNRPQSFARLLYGRASGKFCRRCHFWRFQTSPCFVSRGRRGTLWHSDVFCNVSKVVLCGRRNTFATFSEDALQFSWQAQHFGRVHRHFAWQAQHFVRCAEN